MPERWLDTEYVAQLLPGASRPFKHGPRNCIGQHLAMIAERFAFEKIGLTGRNGEEEVYNSMAVASVPCDGMRVKVKKVCSLRTGFLESGFLISYFSKI